jgi:hypothetical protein
VGELIADIDAGREFWRDGDSIVHSILTWISEAGFEAFFSEYDFPYASAHEFRQRHLIHALKSNRGMF